MTITRKSLVLLLALGVLFGAMTPATAGKKKSGSFSAEALPFPGADGCLGGVEGVHKHSEPLKAPLTGVLTVTMENFQGDWDLFLTDAEGSELMSSTTSQLTGDPAVEEIVLSVKKGMSLLMVPCNWAGGPSADVKWELVGK